MTRYEVLVEFEVEAESEADALAVVADWGPQDLEPVTITVREQPR